MGRQAAMAAPQEERRRGRGSYVLLAVPLLGVLIPTIYNTKDPTFIGIPFFYWYQMLWVPLSVLCTIAVYRATRRRDAP